jgi:hypothetical protein
MTTKAAAQEETEVSSEERTAWEDANRNFAWADAHRDEIERHAGEWICVADGQMVVAEADRDRFAALVRNGRWHGPGRCPYVFYVPTPAEAAAFHPFVHVSAPRLGE